MAKRVYVPSAVLIGSLLHAGTVSALGLGDITLNSFLNEPLDAEVRLIDTRDLMADEIKVRLAGVDDFERFGVDRSYFLTRIQFEVSIDRDRNTGVIRLTTDEPVLEPFVDVIIEARWPTGRLLREYTVLVDPPVFREEPLVVSASEQVAAAEEAASRAAAPEPEPAPPAGSTAGSGGDRVSTRRSDLPAGEMPRRAFSAATADTPAPGERYMVRRDETLWQIASRGRPPGASVQQAMLDIQRLNPEAFIDGNINRIKAGYIIYLPSEGDISSGDLSEALAEVQQQNAEWASQRAGTPGVTAAASLRISADVADETGAGDPDDAGEGDRRGTQVADTAAVSADRRESAQGGDTRVDDGGAVADSGSGDARAAADSELAGQIAAMTERLDTLEQIVALKDEQIATLEEALREARAAAEAPPAAAPAAGAPAARPAPTAPAPTPAPPPAESTGFGAWLYSLGGVLVAALLGLLFWRRRRAADGGDEAVIPAARDEEARDVFAGVTLRDEPDVTRAPPEAPVQPVEEASPAEPAAPAARNNRGYGERRYDDYIDDADAGDALAEADIYIAYGRYLQAAELLNTAIEGEPENTAYRLKLIELYVDMGEPEQARQQLGALRDLGDTDALRRGEAIVSGSAAPAQAEPVRKEPEPAPDALATTERSLFEDDTLPQLPEDESPVQAGDGDENAAQRLPEATASAPLARDEAPVADADHGEMEEVEYEPLEFTLDDLPAAPEESGYGDSANAPSRSLLQDDEALDLELDFDELAIEEDEAGAGSAAPDDDELDLSEALREAEAEPGFAGGDAGSDERGSEDMVFAADADQVATRLDLARAYLDMGDDEGARRILEQVVSEGSQEQQREAQALLERIG